MRAHLANLRQGLVIWIAVMLFCYGSFFVRNMINVANQIESEADTKIAPSILSPIPTAALPKHPKHVPQMVQLEMHFSNPGNVAWSIYNPSSKAITNILYWFILADLDQPYLSHDPLSGRTIPYFPFSIPIQKIDFINSRDTAGSLVLLINIARSIHPGDRIFGVASFSYPNGKDKNYWVFCKFGEAGGWYAPSKSSGEG